MAFKMVTGRLPFLDSMQLFNYVVRGESFSTSTDMSTDLVRFLEQAMAASPRKRISAQDALCDPWMQLQLNDRQEPWIPRPKQDQSPGRLQEESQPYEPSAQWTTISETTARTYSNAAPDSGMPTAQPPAAEVLESGLSSRAPDIPPRPIGTKTPPAVQKTSPPTSVKNAWLRPSGLYWLSFSSDGRWLAGTTAEESTVWEIDRMEQPGQVLYRHGSHDVLGKNAIFGSGGHATFAPDKPWLYIGRNRRIEIWKYSLADGKFQFSATLESVEALGGIVTFSVDASWLAETKVVQSGSNLTESRIGFWKRTTSGNYRWAWCGGYSVPSPAARPSNGPIFIMRTWPSEKPDLQIWRKNENDNFGVSQVFRSRAKYLNDYAISSDTNYLAIHYWGADDDSQESLIIYHQDSHGLFLLTPSIIKCPAKELGPFSFSADGLWFVSAHCSPVSGHVRINLWRRDHKNHFKEVWGWKVGTFPCTAVCFTPDGYHLAATTQLSAGGLLERLGSRIQVWRIPPELGTSPGQGSQ